MNEVAFDHTSVVFPGLGNCHGIVYCNEFGLFAYHGYGNPEKSEGKHEAFASFVRNHIQGSGKGLCLYGACPSNRYSDSGPTSSIGDKEHKKELKIIADALKYTGKIKVVRWDIKKLGWRTTYCEYQRNQSEVTVQVADFSSGSSYHGANTNGFNHKTVTQKRVYEFDKTSTDQSIAFTSCKALDQVIVRTTPVPNKQQLPWRKL
jgi:hypothetical protein